MPDPAFPFLGVHLTKRIDGEVWAGPNAVLAFSREGYGRRDISPRDLFGSLTYRGFQRLATKFLGTGLAEMWRDWSKRAFLAALQKMTPGAARRPADVWARRASAPSRSSATARWSTTSRSPSPAA